MNMYRIVRAGGGGGVEVWGGGGFSRQVRGGGIQDKSASVKLWR